MKKLNPAKKPEAVNVNINIQSEPKYLDPIIVTGCARSGNSLIAGIINKSGVFNGKQLRPFPASYKGYSLNNEVIEKIQKPFFTSIGCDPLGQATLPDTDKLKMMDIPDFKENVIDIMIKQGLEPNQKWFINDAKSCLNWVVWHKAFPQAKWVITRRNELSIAYSCLATSWMSAYDTVEGWEEWIDKHKIKFMEIIKECNAKEIWSEKIINGDYDELKSMLAWLGLDYGVHIVNEFVDKKLWHF